MFRGMVNSQFIETILQIEELLKKDFEIEELKELIETKLELLLEKKREFESEKELKYEIDNIIKDYLNNMKNSAKIDINDSLDKQQRFIGIKISEIERVINKLKDENKKIYIKRIFTERPLPLISDILFDVVNKNYNYETELLFNSFYSEKKDSYIQYRQKIRIPDLKYLTKVDNIDIKFYIDDSEIIQVYGSVSIEYINYFTSEIFVIINANLKELGNLNHDEIYAKLNINFYGIEFKNGLYPWMENIIECAIYQEIGNYKMAIFKCFVAFDSFIQYNYDIIVQAYNGFKINEFNQYLEERLEDLEYEYLRELSDITSKYRIKKYARNICKMYSENNHEIIQYASEIIQEEKLKNINQKKRLIDGKFKNIRNIFEIDLNSKEYGKLSGLFPVLHKIEKYRNNVAHGNLYYEKETKDELYTILTIILSIIYRCDFEQNKWDKLLVNDLSKTKK